MKININGTVVETELHTLSDIAVEFGATPPFALAVNGNFVAKGEYELYLVNEGDLVDIVSPVFGG